eukprot:scaffold1009_cov379-Pavlova_lutheri.AAC.2
MGPPTLVPVLWAEESQVLQCHHVMSCPFRGWGATWQSVSIERYEVVRVNPNRGLRDTKGQRSSTSPARRGTPTDPTVAADNNVASRTGNRV